MKRLSICNKRFYLSRLIRLGDAALNQFHLLFRLITAMLLTLGVIWLNSILAGNFLALGFLALSAVLVVGLVWLGGAGTFTIFASRSSLMDKLNLYGCTVLGSSS